MEASLLQSFDIDELKLMRTEALSALHNVVTLKKPMFLSHDGQQRSYSPQNVPELKSYIAAIQSAIDFKEGNADNMSRPIYFGYGCN